MAGGILTWMTGGDIDKSGWVEEVAVSEEHFLGKQITAVKGVLAWMTGGDIETTG